MEKADPGVLDDSKKPPVEWVGACLSRASSGAQRPAGPLAGSEDQEREFSKTVSQSFRTRGYDSGPLDQ